MENSSKFPTHVYPGQLICPEFELAKKDDQDLVIKYESGSGVSLLSYNLEGTEIKALTATLLGRVKVQENDGSEIPSVSDSEESTKDEKESKSVKTYTVSVVDSDSEDKQVKDDFSNNLPKEGDIVLTRVTKITSQRATVEILAVENKAVPVDSGVGSNGTGVIAPGGGAGAATFSVSQASSDLGETFKGVIRSQDVRATERDRVKLIECFRPGDIVRAQVLSLGDGSNYSLSTARNDLGVVFAKSCNGAGGLMYAIDWQTMVAPSTGLVEARKCAKPF